MTNQGIDTGRSLKLIAAIFRDWATAKEAHHWKDYYETRDSRTYHVICSGPQRYFLGWIIDRDGQEIAELREDDDVRYCA